MTQTLLLGRETQMHGMQSQSIYRIYSDFTSLDTSKINKTGKIPLGNFSTHNGIQNETILTLNLT